MNDHDNDTITSISQESLGYDSRIKPSTTTTKSPNLYNSMSGTSPALSLPQHDSTSCCCAATIKMKDKNPERSQKTQKTQKAKEVVKSKSQLQDDSIMGTNNSSIMSKRSVENLYFQDEPHYFRHFVKKSQRRSPLINRGYWLRMKAIEVVVRKFLEQPSSKKKAIVNLGCGFDPLPWQCRTRYPSISKEALFIDIDYVDLIKKKRDVVLSTSDLNSILTNIEVLHGDVLLRSDQYLQIGCDLRDLVHLQKSLASAIEVDNTTILFIAEVSIAYMPVHAADALIEWGGNFTEAKFCLLEQLLPNGMRHSFATMMMAHFNKIQTPLRPVQRYPTVLDQTIRFENLGWSNVVARNLWELWGAADFLTSSERRAIDLIEPFDEWEELALFACHYILLIADTSIPVEGAFLSPKEKSLAPSGDLQNIAGSIKAELSFTEYSKEQGYKRFASALPIRGLNSSHETFGNFGGMGLTTRVNSIDVYGSKDNVPFSFGDETASPIPSSRMCHTTTDMGNNSTLLVGGRTSPDAAMSDCWVHHKMTGVWERVSDLPNPQYRHQAVCLGNGYVMVAPGKANSKVFSKHFLVWHRAVGWLPCALKYSTSLSTRYGSVFTVNTLDPSQSGSGLRTGILAGGMSEDGVMLDCVWHWELSGLEHNNPVLSFSTMDQLNRQLPIPRFGASSVNHNGSTYIVGGIIQNRLLKHDEEICCVTYQNGIYSIVPVIWEAAEISDPLLVGITLVSTSKSLVIIGGSAVCYAFGTFWNKGCYSLSIPAAPYTTDNITSPSPKEDVPAWEYMHTIFAVTPEQASKLPVSSPSPSSDFAVSQII